MSTLYQFTLILDGVDEKTPGLEDALFEVGCDDALINYRNGAVYLDFDRESDELERAIKERYLMNLKAKDFGRDPN